MQRKGLSWALTVGLLLTNTSSIYAATAPAPTAISGWGQNYVAPAATPRPPVIVYDSTPQQAPTTYQAPTTQQEGLLPQTITLSPGVVINRQDVLTSIGSQEVHTNQEVVFSEADILVPLQQLADSYAPFDTAVSEETLYNSAKSYIEAYYNVDYTTTTLDTWYSQIQPYFNEEFQFIPDAHPAHPLNGKQYLGKHIEGVQRQQLKMSSLFVSDPSLVYTVSPTLANVNAYGDTTTTHFPWAVRGTLFYKFDSLDTSLTAGRFWIPADGEQPNGQWWQADVEIRFGINENVTPYKAVTQFDRVFWISEHATPVQN